MSSLVPSAGAPSGSDAGSAQPEPVADTAAADPIKPIAAPPTLDKPSAQSRLRPIKDGKPRSVALPGITPEGDEGDNFDVPEPPGAKPKVAAADGDRPRTADGKFAKVDGSAPDVPPVDPNAEPAPAKFKFEGEEFDSEDAFKQKYRSMRGTFKSNVERANTAEITLGQERQKGYGWYQEAQRLQAELAKTQQPASGPAPGAEPAKADAAPQGIDWDLYAEIKRVATEAGEPWKAEQWLHSETEKQIQARIDARLDEALKPSREREAQVALSAQVDDAFGTLADYALEDGSPAFPELHSEETAYEVGKLWNSMGLPQEAALSPRGAAIAVMAYRGWLASQGKTPAVPVAEAAALADIPAVPRTEQESAAAANISGGRPDPTPPEPGSDSAEASRIKGALRRVNSHRPAFGFDA